MCRRADRRRRRPFAVLGACIALFVGAGAAGDEVALYLEDHGLTELLAAHLEAQLAAAPSDERELIITRLAGLYADLLSRPGATLDRADLERRSRQLLDLLPPEQASRSKLELTLKWGVYRAAERTAEDWRLRLVDVAAVEAAHKSLSALVPEIESLRRRLGEMLADAQRRAQRASGRPGRFEDDRLRVIESLHSQATFLHGWALYYRAWLGQSRLGLDEAIAAFATILGSEASMPSANDISVDLRDVEVIARSILGVALCHSLNQRQRTALEWIRLLDHPQAFPALREQAPAWTLVIDLEQQDYTAARAEIDRLVARSVDVPAVWLRLVAVQSLEEQLDPDARKLARWAVTELASRGELQQVLDLAERYGVSALGDRGFALRYVSGILVYQAVRAAHDSTEPATNPDHLARYADAAKDFALALSELDAAQYPDAVAACRKLAAWCLFFQGNFIDARLAFLEAEKSLKGDDAAEALWMAIACADRLVKAGAGERLAAELDTLVERFLRDYPSDERAPTLVLMRAYKADDASPELVDELLAVPESSDMRAPAVRRAAAMLYALHHDATTIDAAAEYGQRYLDLAVPLVMSDQHEVSGAGDGATRFAVDCRRCLDVALSESIANPRLARLVFAAFDAVGERVPEIVAEHRDEIDYRRIVAAAYEDDLSVADAFADAIWTRDPTTVWARSGARTLFEIGRRRLEDDRVEDDRMALDLVVRHGLRILEEYAGTPGARDDSRLMYIHTVVAQGLTRLWSRSPNDTALARQALAMHEETLAQRPRDGEALRSVGLLSEALGEPARAMECWRLIVAATSVRTEPWYEAKYHLVSVLATVEPERARAVMDQYRQLNPDLGPPPWNERFAALDARIPAAPGKENP